MARSASWRFRWTLTGLVALAALGAVVGCGGGKPPAKKSSGSSKPSAGAVSALEQARAYLVDGKRRKAIEAYTRAIKLDPKSAKAFVGRGVAYNELGEHKKAVKDFTKAIELDPTDSYPFEQRAAIYGNVYRDERKAAADRKAAEKLRNENWNELPKKRADFEKRRKGR